MDLSKKELRFRHKILTDDEVRALVKAAEEFMGPGIMAIFKNYHLSMEDSLRYMSLSVRMEDARTARGLTLKEAAKELKTPQYQLNYVEKGNLRNLEPGLLVKYVEYLGLKAWFDKWKKANPELCRRIGVASGAGKVGVGAKATIPVLVKKLAEKKLNSFCSNRIPPHAAHQVRLSYTFRGNTVTILEHRAPWRQGDTEWSEMSIAQLRYNQKNGTWMLYCADRNDKWHVYTELSPTKNIDDILTEIDRDPTHIFWG